MWTSSSLVKDEMLLKYEGTCLGAAVGCHGVAKHAVLIPYTEDIGCGDWIYGAGTRKPLAPGVLHPGAAAGSSKYAGLHLYPMTCHVMWFGGLVELWGVNC